MFRFFEAKRFLAKIVTHRGHGSKVTKEQPIPKKKKSDKRIKDAPIKFFVERPIFEKFDAYCDRTGATKSELFREYIDFLLDNPELDEHLKQTGRSRKEFLQEALKRDRMNEGEK